MRGRVMQGQERFILKRTAGRQKGFTLIEVLVAISILTIGILGIAGLMGTAVKSSSFSQTMTQATNLAEDRIEALQEIDFNNIQSTDLVGRAELQRNCTQTSALVSRPVYTCVPINTVTYDNKVYTWTYTVTYIDLDNSGVANPGSDGLKRLDVTVTWTDVWNNPKTTTLTTLRTRG